MRDERLRPAGIKTLLGQARPPAVVHLCCHLAAHFPCGVESLWSREEEDPPGPADSHSVWVSIYTLPRVPDYLRDSYLIQQKNEPTGAASNCQKGELTRGAWVVFFC